MAIVTKAVVGKNACSETGLSPKDAAILVDACFEAIQATLESEEEGWPRRRDVDLDRPGAARTRPQPAAVLCYSAPLQVVEFLKLLQITKLY